ncbi:hypothetical protein TNCV_1415611 [Trichonephila clavipes]|nr:hypothetical protein TNCV_1415611 [Trichonephila clavipes]
MFSEALTRPLYTLNCTVLPPAFCDWLFNSEVENDAPGSLDSRLKAIGKHRELKDVLLGESFENCSK